MSDSNPKTHAPGGPGRRALLKAGLGAGLLAALPWPALAVGRFTLGEVELTTVSDGTLVLPMAFALPGLPEDERDALLAASGQATDALRPDCNVTFLKTGERLVAFDAGSGPNFMPTAGDLPGNLADAGIDPAAVTDVVFTHAHPDHIWGITDDFDDLVFPNAAYHIGRVEWDFWSSPEAFAALPAERQSFVAGAQNRFAVLEDRIAFIEPGDEVVPGVEAFDTSGHTPGHLSYIVHGGKEQMVVGGDALTNVALSFARPDWPSGTDQDKDRAVATRLKFLDRLATDRARLIGYHLPHPGAGIVERDGDAYRFVPV